MATDKTIPNLENATPGFLVDELGKIRAEASRLKFLEGIYKQALEARCTPTQLNGTKFIMGETFVGDWVEKTQERVDTNKVKEVFADKPEILAQLMKVITFKQLNIKPIK